MRSIIKNIAKALCLAIVLQFVLLTGCSETKNNSESVGLKMAAGESLHVDMQISSGTVDVSVTDGAGTELFGETPNADDTYSTEVFKDGEYTVRLDWHNAHGSAQIYAEKDGEWLRTVYGNYKG